MQELERNLAVGLESAMDSIEDWIKQLLTKVGAERRLLIIQRFCHQFLFFFSFRQEQQKTDFKPDEEMPLNVTCTTVRCHCGLLQSCRINGVAP